MTPERERLLTVLGRQIARLDRRLLRIERRSVRLSWLRLALVVGGAAVAFAAYRLSGDAAGGFALLAAAGLFVAVARVHQRVEASAGRHRIWRRLKETHVARMTLDWGALPPPVPSPDETHPFERDLNLTGARSVHRLLDGAVSEGGSRRLLDWLLAPEPDVAALPHRQALVRELRPMGSFRDRLALAGALATADPHERWDGERLLDWLRRPEPTASLRRWLRLLGLLAAVDLVLFALFALGRAPAYWTVSLLIYTFLYYLRVSRMRPVFDEAFRLEQSLKPFRAVLDLLERRPLAGRPRLAALCAPFRTGEQRPSRHLRRIGRIASGASFQNSQVAGLVLNLLMPWNLYFALRLAEEKNRIRPLLPVWLDVWYELEALNSLARYADLHPHLSFPTVAPAAAGEPVFRAERLGHPLLPEERKVRNDFTVPAVGHVALVTGSNMAGKSTFLRAVGVNLALAYAGAPVDARALRAAPFRLFTCIQVSDSVSDGISYFYAEVRRLKRLHTALRDDHPLPLFFLIDEIFRGTNNRERLIGSRAFIRALAGGHGAGLVSTHDLELVQLAEEIPALRNFHFREQVEEGRMVFDFLLRPGPCPTTNALKIMRMEGLPVEEG